MEQLAVVFPKMKAAWTARAPLPGGDFPDADFDAFLADWQRRHDWVPAELARHYARLYGTQADRVIGSARSLSDLGRHFGGLLYEREARYLCEAEWAETAEDILQRRTKHGLHLDQRAREALEQWLRAA